MRLWLLQWRNLFETKRFEAGGFVVRAESEIDARNLILDSVQGAGREGPMVWLDPEKTTCVPLEHAGEPGVVIRDFLYG